MGYGFHTTELKTFLHFVCSSLCFLHICAVPGQGRELLHGLLCFLLRLTLVFFPVFFAQCRILYQQRLNFTGANFKIGTPLSPFTLHVLRSVNIRKLFRICFSYVLPGHAVCQRHFCYEMHICPGCSFEDVRRTECRVPHNYLYIREFLLEFLGILLKERQKRLLVILVARNALEADWQSPPLKLTGNPVS